RLRGSAPPAGRGARTPRLGQAQPRRHRALVDQPAYVAGAAGVEVDVALPDAGLLREEPRVEQRLADRERERALVALREAAAQMHELRVVAAPLAHPVEALEDAAGDAAGRVGVVVGACDRARR